MNDLYGLAFQKLLYPGWETGVRRRPTLKYLKRLERTQWCSFDELTAFQQTELNKLLDHAYAHVPHVRKRFDRAGLLRSDVRRVEDLARLPLLTRDEATREFPARKSTVEPLPVIDKMTSGTTGNPLCFAYDLESEYWRQATKLRGYAWAGYRLGDRSLHFWGAPGGVVQRPLPQRLKIALDQSFRREYYVDCTERSEAFLESVVRRIRATKPKVMVCYSQAGAALARHVIEHKSRTWSDISVICAAERLFPSDRAAMVEAFGPGVFETYGSRETMLIAGECEAHEGMHVPMENIVVEVVVRDGDRERPAEPGELGEVAVTDLHNLGAPFIRYLNGDLAIMRKQERCSCGRYLTRLEAVEGRTNDTLRDGAGRPVSGMFFNVLFASMAHKVRQFQVVQRKDRAIDLRIVPAPLFDNELLDVVKNNCARFLPGVELRTEIVPALAAERNGKLRVVVVEN
jgi:phenylacetate-CoA ligase